MSNNKYWNNDTVQFARLIAELNAYGVFNDEKVTSFLSESTGLCLADIDEVVERAEKRFGSDKEVIFDKP